MESPKNISRLLRSRQKRLKPPCLSPETREQVLLQVSSDKRGGGDGRQDFKIEKGGLNLEKVETIHRIQIQEYKHSQKLLFFRKLLLTKSVQTDYMITR